MLIAITAVSALFALVVLVIDGESSSSVAALGLVYALAFGWELVLGVGTSNDGIAVQQRFRWWLLTWDEISGFEVRPHYLFQTGAARLQDGSLIAISGVASGSARPNSPRGVRTIVDALNAELESRLSGGSRSPAGEGQSPPRRGST